MNIDLPQDVHDFVKGLVVAGQYSSEEQVITTSLRLLMSQRNNSVDVAKGFKQIDEGDPIDGDAMFDELDAVVGTIEAENPERNINASNCGFLRRDNRTLREIACYIT